MKNMNRREAFGAISAFALMASVMEAQTGEGAVLANSRVFEYDKLPVKKSDNGGESRAVVHGTLPTGEFVELHNTTLPAGKMPHKPHKHPHSEFVLFREGNCEYLADGVAQKVGPGDIVFTASMKPHGLRNIGTTPAKYFVVAIGVQAPSVEVELTPPA